MPSKNNWKNEDNHDFYKAIPEQIIRELYGRAGMLSCINGKISESFFAISHGSEGETLEIGAGFGRIISELQGQGYKKLTAVEVNPQFIQTLKQNFPSLRVHQQSIQEFTTDKKFDNIGCWYSMFLEFNPSEQEDLLSKLASISTPNSIIIIDIVPVGAASNSTNTAGQNIQISLPGTPSIRGYIPMLEELRAMALDKGLVSEFVLYWTDTGRQRAQCILTPITSTHIDKIKQLAATKSNFFATNQEYKNLKISNNNSAQVRNCLNFK